MEILEKVKSLLPPKAVTRVELEGSEVIVYTKDQEFFRKSDETIRDVVREVKKRIEIRLEKNLLMDEEKVKEKIHEIVPQEANIKDIYFEPERSIVVIAAEKPGLVIGKGGETFRNIRSETYWIPRIERVPAIKSDIVDTIRKVMHSEVKFRKEFLNKVGETIFSDRKSNRDWVRIIGLGGWKEVGRSAALLETPKSKVLIDCGIKAGAQNSEVYPIFGTKEFDYNELDAIVISHSHMDHVGAVPMLYEYGFNGPLYITTPALDLATLLWFDYVDVMQKNMGTPLYTVRGIKEAIRHAIPLEYGEVSDVAPDVRLTMQNGGHILGSALPHFHVGEGMHNIVYALDQKFGKTTLLDPAYTDFQRVETLIIESTYGGAHDIMPHRAYTEKELMDIVNKTMEKRGVVIIPSFAVERAQEVMAVLIENGFEYPIYLDGMIWDANGIFTAYPEYLGRNVQKQIFQGENPFLNKAFKRIASQQEREKAWEDKPCVIVSTSGMLIGGPVMEHLRHFAEDPNSTLLFVGYQAEGSMGRRLQNGWREIPVKAEGGKTVNVQLKINIETIEGLSAHSDRNQLLAFIGRLSSRPDRTICVHGDPQKTMELARGINQVFRIPTDAPMNLESLRLK
ncbi:MAG: beta-CASP ribonuclease aCPSF1 [Candidatus Aenigmarchaeota archaeon]|nr:beta-CASP ribonuclease aCPSF1 [Candidatus Aenigmarchaeota archaeon]